MSSATSIERDAPASNAGRQTASSAGNAPRDAFQPWHFFLLLSLAAATVAVILARQSRPESLVLISLTIGAAGFAAGALYRTLAPLVSGTPPAVDVPLRDTARAELEREKALVLRAIKELEFDHAMGKVSATDFEEMAGRLRGRAIAIMRQLDATSAYREMIERDLAARLRHQPTTAPAPAVETSGPAPGTACACGTANDPDAAFCKRCGTKLGSVQS
jgi:hypothetical protein